MRIVSGSGDSRGATVVCGSIYNAQGYFNRHMLDVRRTVGRVIKGRLFPTNAAFHKAKRRGDKAIAMMHPSSFGLSLV